jgi:hypothetical protein
MDAAAFEKPPPKSVPLRPLQKVHDLASKYFWAVLTTTQHRNHDKKGAEMKLNVKNIRYLTPEDWRVLTAVCVSSQPIITHTAD